MLVSTPNYGGFVEDSDPYYLGVAKDSAKVNWLNKEGVNEKNIILAVCNLSCK